MKSYIVRNRKELTDPSTDDDIELKEGDDYYAFSHQVWRFFFETYGGGPTVIIKYTKVDRIKDSSKFQNSCIQSFCITDQSQLRS